MYRLIGKSMQFMMEHRFLCLLFTIVLLILISPHLTDKEYGAWILSLLSVAVTISAVLTLLKHKSMQVFVILFALVVVGLNLATNFSANTLLNVINLIAAALFYGLTIIVLFHKIFTGESITHQTIIISLNIYFLIGILFSLIYMILVFIEPNAFFFGETVTNTKLLRFDLLYFSFTTLSTVGFGDIVAISPTVKSIVILEEVTGVLYIAILVARLVAGLQVNKK